MKIDRFKLIASSYLFLIENGKILLSKRQNTGYEDGKYSLPAGHLNEGETIKDCLVREVKEEVGLVIKKQEAELVHVMHRKEEDIRLDFFYVVKKYRGKLKNMEPNKCGGLKWFAVDNLPKNMVPYIKQALEQYLEGAGYSEIGF